MLESLNDKDAPLDIERAKAVADVAQVIINPAKVEVNLMRVAAGKGTGFIAEEKPNGITGITRHVLS
ncbi:hypothetical protein [Paraburkholderia terrae]